MNDDELLTLATRLEASADFEASESRLSGHKHRLWLEANRDAMLCFAAAFLRASTSPPNDERCSKLVELEHRQTIDDKTEYALGFLQQVRSFTESPEEVARRQHIDRRRDRISLFGCAFAALILVSLLLSGVVFWWHLFTGTPLRP